MQSECKPYTAKKLVLNRGNLFKFAESWKAVRQETHPEEYAYELPSFCAHITKMINQPPHKYVFAADFLARGYRFDRSAAEKMWRMICVPEETVFEDVATAIFTNNPDMGGKDEEEGIWKSVPKTSDLYPFDIDANPMQNFEVPPSLSDVEEAEDSDF